MATTYVLTDTNSDLTSQGTVHNKKALAAGGGGTSLDITLSGGASGSAAWYTEPSDPNLTEWPAGNLAIAVNIDATGADITYTFSLLRVNSAGVLQQTIATSGPQSGTGAKGFSPDLDSPIATSAGDRLVGKILASRGASHGNQTLTISVNGAGDLLTGPWSAAQLIPLNQASDTSTAQAIGKNKGKNIGLASSLDSMAAFVQNEVSRYDDLSGASGGLITDTGDLWGQVFTASASGLLVRVDALLKRDVADVPTTGGVVAELRVSSGTPGSTGVGTSTVLATSDLIAVADINTSAQGFAWEQFNFDGSVQIEAGQNYAVVFRVVDSDGDFQVHLDTTSPSHAGNATRFNGSWIAESAVDLFHVVVVSQAKVIDVNKSKVLGPSESTDTAQTITAEQAGGQDIDLLQASETNTSTALGKTKAKAAAQASETDTAQPVAKTKAKALGQASVTDTAQALAPTKSKAIGLASETGTAQSITLEAGQDIDLGQASETNTAQSFTSLKARSLAQATDAEVAQALTSAKDKALSQAADAESAQPVGKSKAKAIGQSSETGTAQALTSAKARALAQAVDAETARTITSLGNKNIALGQSQDSETTNSLTSEKTKSLVQVSTTEAAQTFVRLKVKSIGISSETGSSQATMAVKTKEVGQTQETVVAHALLSSKTRVLGQAIDVEFAQVFIGGAPPPSGGGWHHYNRRRRRG